MVVAIHQPDYLPYPGLFYKILRSDVFVFLDDAQFSNSAGHDFNLIKTPQGAQKLKVPVRQTLGDRINQVPTRDDLNWKRRHLTALELSYKKAPYFDWVFGMLSGLLNAQYESIAQMNMAIIRSFCEACGYKREILLSSQMRVESKNEQRILDICHLLGGDTYFSGTGARSYQIEEHFSSAGVRLVYSDYHPIVYPQLWGSFIENLSMVDYFMNCGLNFDCFKP